MKALLLVACILFALLSEAQSEFTIKPLFDLNSDLDEVACMLLDDQLVVMTAQPPDLISDYQWNQKPRFELVAWQRGSDFSRWSKPEPYFLATLHDIGPVSYNPLDSVLYFSTTSNFRGSASNRLKIFSSQWNGRRWQEPVLLSFVVGGADYCHPHYVPWMQMLIYTSNCAGGQGAMDVWYVMKTPFGWSEPANLGLGVNTPNNEIFPTFHGNDIYYATNATDTWGGYDIRRALGTNQWKTCIAEGAPINSAGDDVCLLFLSDEKAILTSNRIGGRGGDDLFLIQRAIREEEKHTMQARLECEGMLLAGVSITVRNGTGEVIQSAITDQDGGIDISALRINQTYSFQAIAANGELGNCLLVVDDAKGNRLTEVRFNAKGFAWLELLPFKFSASEPMLVKDESLLKLSIEGQLYEESLGDVGRGEPITILNAAGEAVAIAYTNEVGKFRFTKLDPQLKYVLRLSSHTEANRVLITDNGSRLDLPILNAEINYQRLQADEAVVLVNEFNDTIHVSPLDLFVINRIYYDYNSARLTHESRRQLMQLALLLNRNVDVSLELRSHTDARGDEAFNKKLSEARAKSAIEFLCAEGLSRQRLNAVGMGETRLLNECADGIQCSEPEHAINRRTEIRLAATAELAEID